MLHSASRGVLWKITSTARKSRNAIRNEPTKSSTNDARYCNCERMPAPTSRLQTAIASATLHHELPRRAREYEPAEGEQRHGPHGLQRDPPRMEVAEPHVDRRLERRRERQQLRDRRE